MVKNNLQYKISKFYNVNINYCGQRIDNYLINHLKYIPKNKIYHLIRNGKIQVNNQYTFFFINLT